MKVSLLIPWRSDGPEGHRQKVWDYLRPLWEKTEFEVCVGEDDVSGPHDEPLSFSCSQALNRAAAKAGGDVFVTMGADYFPMPAAVQRAAELALRYPPYWMPVFGAVEYVSEGSTKALLSGALKTENHTILRNMIDAVDQGCMGITAVKASMWHQVGGMDERYRGWGWEDTDLRRRLTAASYQHKPKFLHTRGVALWHDGGHRDLTYNNPNRRLFESGA